MIHTTDTWPMRVLGARRHQPRCTCGWKGEPAWKVEDAEAEGAKHEASSNEPETSGVGWPD